MAAFIVTGAVPVEVRVRDCIVVVFTVTLPKPRLPALNVNCGVGAAILVPLNTTSVSLPVEELLLILNRPFAAPVTVGLNRTCSVIDCVGFSVAGRKPPARVKPAPAIATEFTVTGAVPVEFSVSVWVITVFTVTLPKLRLPALIVSWGLGAAVLVPWRITAIAPPAETLLLIVNCPFAEPVAVGWNCTRRLSDCIGFNVAGRLPPIRVKPSPVIAAELTITGTVPVEVKVRACVVVLFTVTLPKLRLPALTANCGLAAAVPIPLNATTTAFSTEESLLMASCPLANPVVVGWKRTCTVNDCDGFSVAGSESPSRVKPAPAIAAEFTVTGAVPVELNVSACVVSVFTVTSPKLRLPALTIS